MMVDAEGTLKWLSMQPLPQRSLYASIGTIQSLVYDCVFRSKSWVRIDFRKNSPIGCKIGSPYCTSIYPTSSFG